MVIEISVAVAVFIFAILTVFIVRTLMSVQKALDRIDHTVADVEKKMSNLDPSLHAIANIGTIFEKKTDELKNSYFQEQKETIPQLSHDAKKESSHEHKKGCRCDKDKNETGFTKELVDWLIVSIKLGEKLLNRR